MPLVESGWFNRACLRCDRALLALELTSRFEPEQRIIGKQHPTPSPYCMLRTHAGNLLSGDS